MKIIAILLIIAIAFCIAYGIDLLMNSAEEGAYPQKYSEYVEKYAKEYNIPEYVIYGVIKVESDFDPLARSSVGACGLMQMTPKTFSWLTSSEHLGENLTPDELFDAEVSIRYGTYYLKYLFTRFHNWDTVLAAYNGGEGNVAKWLADDEYSNGDGTLKYIPFKETRNYVKKVNQAIDNYKNT